MPFREEHEALLARIETLERELATARDDRAKIEAELAGARKGAKKKATREAAEESPPSSAPASWGTRVTCDGWYRDNARRDRRRHRLVGTLLGALYRHANDPGELHATRFVPLEDGRLGLVLLERCVEHAGRR